MTTSYTTLLGMALPVTGELAGTWGDTVNSYITQYVDAAVAGAQTISGTQTAVTLSVTNGSSLTQVGGSGSTGSAQYQIINCTGNPSGTLTITAPSQSKVYLILNATSTAQSVKIVASGPTTGVTVATGKAALVAWNGSDFTLIATNDASKISGVLAVANGGTGLSSYTTGDLLYASGSTALSKLGIGTALQVLKVNAGATAPEWVSGAALTKVDDTNVTLTLGGTPATSLLAATSLTLGWTGQLSLTRGGTNANLTASAGSVAYSTASAIALNTAGNSGDWLKSGGTGAPAWTSPAALTKTDDTNVTLTLGGSASTALLNAASLTLGWTGQLSVSRGGTGIASGTSGGVPYFSGTTTIASSAALAANAIVLGGGAGAAPATTTTGTGVVTAIGNNTNSASGLAVLNASGYLAIAQGGTNSNATPTAGGVGYGTGTAHAYTAAGTSNQVLISNGASAPTWSNLSSIGVTTFSAGTTGFTPNSATSGAITLAGTLATTNGGTGLTSFTANGVVYASSTSALATGSTLSFDGTTLSTNGFTASGTVTLSGGTANGVLYLNGSKVATSGSALTWSGTQLAIDGSASTVSYKVKYNGSEVGFLQNYQNTELDFGTTVNAPILFYVNNTEQMRLTSTGLGIGTSSPSTKLHANTSDTGNGINYGFALTNAASGSATSYAMPAVVWQNGGLNWASVHGERNSAGGYGGSLAFYTMNTSGTNTLRATIDNAGNVGIGTSSPSGRLDVDTASNTYLNVYTSNTNSAAVQTFISGATSDGAAIGYNVALRFGTATGKNAASFSEKARFDSSGNLGLGVTPSAWGSYRALQVGATSAIYTSSGTGYYTILSNNVYKDSGGTSKYIVSSYATEATQESNGSFIWRTAASGTAGTAISFTQAMTLDASGNLALGVTSSARKLTVRGGNDNTLNIDNDGSQYTSAYWSNAGTGVGEITWDNTNKYFIVSADAAASILVLRTAGTERARIDSSGNVLVTGVGGLGYGTGSGGAVTQATSRTTGVTLDKTNGAITLVSAAGTTTWQTFTVTNAKVAATDTIIVNQKSGTDLYEIHVTAVAAGSFNISFKTTGGTTTEQPVFNFAVIKAVTA